MSINKVVNLVDSNAVALPVGSIIWVLSVAYNSVSDERWLPCNGDEFGVNVVVDDENNIVSASYTTKDNVTHDVTTFVKQMNNLGAGWVTINDTGTIATVKIPTLEDGATVIGCARTSDGILKIGSEFKGNMPFDTGDNGNAHPGKNVFGGATAYNTPPSSGGAFHDVLTSGKLAGASSHGGVCEVTYNFDISKIVGTEYTHSNITGVVPKGICARAFIKAW